MKPQAKTGHLKNKGKLLLNKPESYKKAGEKSRGAKAFRETPRPVDPWGRKP